MWVHIRLGGGVKWVAGVNYVGDFCWVKFVGTDKVGG